MGVGVKNENSTPFDQTQPNFVYLFWGPQKARNAKTNHPKWGWGSKMKILALSTKLNQILFTNSVNPQEARNAKTKLGLVQGPRFSFLLKLSCFTSIFKFSRVNLLKIYK